MGNLDEARQGSAVLDLIQSHDHRSADRTTPLPVSTRTRQSTGGELLGLVRRLDIVEALGFPTHRSDFSSLWPRRNLHCIWRSKCGPKNTCGPLTEALTWSPRVQLADLVLVRLGSNPTDSISVGSRSTCSSLLTV
jgi:hypothetical protein